MRLIFSKAFACYELYAGILAVVRISRALNTVAVDVELGEDRLNTIAVSSRHKGPTFRSRNTSTSFRGHDGSKAEIARHQGSRSSGPRWLKRRLAQHQRNLSPAMCGQGVVRSFVERLIAGH